MPRTLAQEEALLGLRQHAGGLAELAEGVEAAGVAHAGDLEDARVLQLLDAALAVCRRETSSPPRLC